jgi:hypothetical protein
MSADVSLCQNENGSQKWINNARTKALCKNTRKKVLISFIYTESKRNHRVFSSGNQELPGPVSALLRCSRQPPSTGCTLRCLNSGLPASTAVAHSATAARNDPTAAGSGKSAPTTTTSSSRTGRICLRLCRSTSLRGGSALLESVPSATGR